MWPWSRLIAALHRSWMQQKCRSFNSEEKDLPIIEHLCYLVIDPAHWYLWWLKLCRYRAAQTPETESMGHKVQTAVKIQILPYQFEFTNLTLSLLSSSRFRRLGYILYSLCCSMAEPAIFSICIMTRQVISLVSSRSSSNKVSNRVSNSSATLNSCQNNWQHSWSGACVQVQQWDNS